MVIGHTEPAIRRSGTVRGVEGVERTIWWESVDPPVVGVLDQRRLPHELVIDRWRTVDDAARAIREMVVRGAPLIGVAAAHGVALALAADAGALDVACTTLAATRPTAVNLTWALARCRRELAPVRAERRAAAAIDLAARMADADVAACRTIGEAGVGLLAAVHELTGRAVNVLTHCNAGMLACVEWGTATAPIYVAHERGIPVHVWVSETRPRNQGALTAWELGRAGVAHTYLVDNAAGHLLASGDVDLVITGADRVAANGDTVNKVGTVLKAFAAAEHGVPFHVAVPASTFDAACAVGADVVIEERDAHEVVEILGHRVAPDGTAARNWAFDVTPARLVTSWITDRGVLTVDELAGLGSSG